MPTYSLRRARFNTSKCCNASQLTLIIKACASPVHRAPAHPSIHTHTHTHPQGQGCVSLCAYLQRTTQAHRLNVNSCILRGNQYSYKGWYHSPPSAGTLYDRGLAVWWWEHLQKVTSIEDLIQGMGKSQRGTPWVIHRRRASSEQAYSRRGCQGFPSINACKGPTPPPGNDQRRIPGGGTGGLLNCWWTEGVIKKTNSASSSVCIADFGP